MKVKCINLDGNSFITLNKNYELLDEWYQTKSIKIVDDEGDDGWYYKNLFVDVPEEKENKVEKETIKIISGQFKIVYEKDPKSYTETQFFINQATNTIYFTKKTELKDLIVALENLLKEIESES